MWRVPQESPLVSWKVLRRLYNVAVINATLERLLDYFLTEDAIREGIFKEITNAWKPLLKFARILVGASFLSVLRVLDLQFALVLDSLVLTSRNLVGRS